MSVCSREICDTSTYPPSPSGNPRRPSTKPPMRSSLSPESARLLLFSPPPRKGPLHLYLRVGNDLVTTRPYAFGPWSRLPTRGIRSSQAERVDASGSASLPRRWSCSSLSFNFSRKDGGAELEQFLPRDISSRIPPFHPPLWQHAHLHVQPNLPRPPTRFRCPRLKRRTPHLPSFP